MGLTAGRPNKEYVENKMSKNWYVVHTYSGFEKFVAESVHQRAHELGIEDQIGKIIIPTEGVVEIKGGKRSYRPNGHTLDIF